MIPSSRPVGAFVCGLIGGVLILVGGIVFLLLSPFFFGIFSILALIFGILVIVGSVLLFRFPERRLAWGIVIVVFSVCSIVGFGGFIAGMILGIIGGAMGIAWKPESERAHYGYAPGPYGMPVMPWRMCMGCGRWIPWTYNMCPLCGTSAPIAPWVPTAADPPSASAPGASPPVGSPYAPPAQETIRAPCPTCEGEAEWMAQQKRWFCPAESKYF